MVPKLKNVLIKIYSFLVKSAPFLLFLNVIILNSNIIQIKNNFFILEKEISVMREEISLIKQEIQILKFKSVEDIPQAVSTLPAAAGLDVFFYVKIALGIMLVGVSFYYICLNFDSFGSQGSSSIASSSGVALDVPLEVSTILLKNENNFIVDKTIKLVDLKSTLLVKEMAPLSKHCFLANKDLSAFQSPNIHDCDNFDLPVLPEDFIALLDDILSDKS
jgi:hypothetical protein